MTSICNRIYGPMSVIMVLSSPLIVLHRESSFTLAWSTWIFFAIWSSSGWISRQRSGLGLAVADLGACLNCAAMAANGWTMPVLKSNMHPTRLHPTVPFDKMHLPLLCDIHAGASVGDMLLATGAVLAISIGIWKYFHEKRFQLNPL